MSSQTLAKLYTEHAFIYAPSPEWHYWRVCHFHASSYVVHCCWLVLSTRSLRSHLFNSIHSSMDGFYNCTIMVAIVQSILVNLRGKSHWWDTGINIDSAMESRSESGQSRGPIVPRCNARFPGTIGNLIVGAFLVGTWQRKLTSRSYTCRRGQRP